MKTEDVLKDMHARHLRERRETDEAHASTLEFVRSLCDAGLVTDVEPTPSARVEIAPLTCALCGKEIDEACQTCR